MSHAETTLETTTDGRTETRLTFGTAADRRGERHHDSESIIAFRGILNSAVVWRRAET